MADVGNHCIRMVYPNGTVVTLVGTGNAGSSNTAPSTLAYPTHVALDSNAGFLYVVEAASLSAASSTRVRKVDVGTAVTSTALTTGTSTLNTAPRVFALNYAVRGVAIDPVAGVLYLGDNQHVVKSFSLSTSTVSAYAGISTISTSYPSLTGLSSSSYTNSTAGAAVPLYDLAATAGSSATTCRVQFPGAMAWDATSSPGRLFLADNIRPAVRVVQGSPLTMSTFAGSGIPGTADGAGTAAGFSWSGYGYNQVSGMAVGRDGTLYVTDAGNSVVRKISTTGTVTTIAGVKGSPGYADGPGGSATFRLKGGDTLSQSDVTSLTMSGLTVDQFDNVYVSEISTASGLPAHRIRKIVPYSCSAGQYLSGGSCFTCAAGTYQSFSAFAGTMCTICPAGTWSASGASAWCVMFVGA